MQEAELKKAEVLRKKEEGKKMRATAKEVIALCCEKMPGSKYDKYYLDEFIKPWMKPALIEELLQKFKDFGDDFAEEF